MSPGWASPSLLLYFATLAAHCHRQHQRDSRRQSPRWCPIRTAGRAAERS